MRIVLIDTLYPDFIRSLPFDPNSTYEVEHRKVMDAGFGTSNFFSTNLRELGWSAIDLIVNHQPLQEMWMRDHSFKGAPDLGAQLSFYDADAVFLQDLSIQLPYKPRFLAAQCSCAFNPAGPNIRNLDVVFTSLPGHVEKFKALGVPRVEYLPLAFEPRMLKYASPERDIDISCCAGVGRESHWKAGTDVLEAVAERFKERFHWYGYGIENLLQASPLRPCYRGEAWGRKMYEIYGRSKIVVNRHGEVAQGFINNLRCFEATGMGAMLETEEAENIGDLFPYGTVGQYSSPHNLCGQIDEYLKRDDLRVKLADRGQKHTLQHHTYTQRMSQVSRVLNECMESRKVAQ